MKLQFHDTDQDILILHVDGGLNMETADQFHEELERIIDSGTNKVIVDCATLEFLSSYGIGVLLWLHKKMRRHGGNVKLCSIKGVVGDILRYTGLDTFFQVYPNLDAARAAFAHSSGTAQPAAPAAPGAPGASGSDKAAK